MSAYGEAIRKARVDRGLSLRAAAKQIGISHVFLGQIEQGRGRITEARVEAAAEALGIKPWRLRALAALDSGEVSVSGLPEPEIERVVFYIERVRKRAASG